MEKRNAVRIGIVALLALVAYFAATLIHGIVIIGSIPSGIVVTPYSVENASFGAFSCDLSVGASAGAAQSNGKLSFKLFGVIPIKTIDVLCDKEREVRLGGFPVGIVLNIDGVIVDDIGYVETSAGKASIGDGIEVGDVILNLDDTRINSVKDLTEYMNAYSGGDRLRITLNRKGRVLQVKVSPLIDSLSGAYKLGLWVRDSISGVGTTSFVKDDNSFAALGHGIAFDDFITPISGGYVYNCDILGVNRGSKGVPGELKGVLRDTDNPIGEISSNNEYGVYGRYYDNAEIPEKRYKVGSRLNVRNGKAKIYSTVNGVADFYDIEIIRAMPQSERSTRSMVVRVTDKRLLSQSGGIVRGMSGSPIIQNDMIVGAVTHVFVNDPTKGYGLYLDWMYL